MREMAFVFGKVFFTCGEAVRSKKKTQQVVVLVCRGKVCHFSVANLVVLTPSEVPFWGMCSSPALSLQQLSLLPSNVSEQVFEQSLFLLGFGLDLDGRGEKVTE